MNLTFRMTVVATTLAAWIASNDAFAQLGEFRPAEATYEYHAPVTYAPGERVRFDVYKAGLSYPVTIAEKKTYFFPSLAYEQVSASGSALEANGNFYTMSLGTMLVQRFGEHWRGVLKLNYGIASNLAGSLSWADAFITGNLIALYKFSPEFTLGAGVGYDRRTGKLLPIPLGVIYWEPVRNFAIRGVVPSKVYVAWRPLEIATLQLMGALEGERFHLADQEDDGQEAQLEYSLIKVGTGVRFHLTKFAHIELVGGALVARKFEMFADRRSRDSSTIPPGPFVGISVWIGDSGWKNDFVPQVDP